MQTSRSLTSYQFRMRHYSHAHIQTGSLACHLHSVPCTSSAYRIHTACDFIKCGRRWRRRRVEPPMSHRDVRNRCSAQPPAMAAMNSENMQSVRSVRNVRSREQIPQSICLATRCVRHSITFWRAVDWTRQQIVGQMPASWGTSGISNGRSNSITSSIGEMARHNWALIIIGAVCFVCHDDWDTGLIYVVVIIVEFVYMLGGMRVGDFRLILGPSNRLTFAQQRRGENIQWDVDSIILIQHHSFVEFSTDFRLCRTNELRSSRKGAYPITEPIDHSLNDNQYWSYVSGTFGE